MSADRFDERIPARPPVVSVLLAVAVTLIALDQFGPAGPAVASLRLAARSALAPAEAAGEALTAPVAGWFEGATRAGALRGENARLRRELRLAGAGAAGLEAAVLEGRRVAGALVPDPALPGAAGAPGTPARVVSLPAARPGSTVLLDRGSEAGIRVGMPVVVGGALVGRVVEAEGGRAAVLPVSDPGFAAGVRMAGTGEIGVAHGTGPGGDLRLELLDPEAAGAAGDLAVTSGLRHGSFPAGIPVGRVRGTGRSAFLVPLAGLTRLEVVEVLRWVPE